MEKVQNIKNANSSEEVKKWTRGARDIEIRIKGKVN